MNKLPEPSDSTMNHKLGDGNMTIQSSIQKDKTKALTNKKPRPCYPNKATLHSYMMQALEPDNAAINNAFGEFHPKWVVNSHKTKCNGETLKYWRVHLLKLTQAKMAAYLRTSTSKISKWENNITSIPFVVMELLRLVYESPDFGLSHADWAGWFINKDGRLVAPDTRDLSFHPHELTYVRETYQFMENYRRENEKLKAEIESLQNDLAQHKKTDNSDLMDELKAIEMRLMQLNNQISNSNNVIPLHSNPSTDINKGVKVA